MPRKGKLIIAGGLDYGSAINENENKLFVPETNWNYLPGTRQEAGKLKTILSAGGYSTRLLTGNEFADSSVYS